MDLNFFFKTEMHNEFANALDCFLQASRVVRERLGNKAALLDQYLDHLLEMANEAFPEEVAADGFTAGSDLYGLCRSILSGEPVEQHPFGAQAEAYIAANPIDMERDGDKAWAYFIPLFGKYAEHSVNGYITLLEEKMHAAVPTEKLWQLATAINAALGDDAGLFDAMLLSFREFIGVIPALSIFVSGLQYQLIEALRQKDFLSGRHILQILFEQQLPRA